MPPEKIFSVLPSSLMLANLNIAVDVCRVDKCRNCFLYLFLIAPLCLQIMHCFRNSYFAPSPDFLSLLLWLNVDVTFPLDFLLAMFEPIIYFLKHSVCASCLLESKDSGTDLLCCPCVFPIKLASSFFILILKLKLAKLDSFWCVHFWSSYMLEAFKFTKTELLHSYFSGILTTDSYNNFTATFKKFFKMTIAISKNTFFPEQLKWLLS